MFNGHHTTVCHYGEVEPNLDFESEDIIEHNCSVNAVPRYAGCKLRAKSLFVPSSVLRPCQNWMSVGEIVHKYIHFLWSVEVISQVWHLEFHPLSLSLFLFLSHSLSLSLSLCLCLSLSLSPSVTLVVQAWSVWTGITGLIFFSRGVFE